MEKQAVRQVLKDLMKWQLNLEEQIPQLLTSSEQQAVYEQQNVILALRTQLETQYDLKEESAKEWALLRSIWEESQLEAQKQQKVRHQAKVADQIGFRYLTVLETGEPVIVNGRSQLSVSVFPHHEPEEMEDFKARYVHEPYSCCRLDLTVPAVRTYLGLDDE